MMFGPGHTEDNNNNNNINRYLETFPIENYITALTKTEMHNKQQNLIGKATYTMFEKNEKSLNREEMCFQKFFKLVCGLSGVNEKRDVVPCCGCSYSECAIARFALGPRNGKQKWLSRRAKIRARWVMKCKAILDI